MRSSSKCIDDHRSQCSSASGAQRRVVALIAASVAMFFPTSCAKKVHVAQAPRIGHTETGIASWYGEPYHGRKTASGEVYDMNRWTAAHRTLPFGTWVEVTNLTNAKRVQVRITDRGPFVSGRIIDLSRAAAQQIEMLGPGTARVHLKVIRAPSSSQSTFYYAVQVATFNDRAEAEQLKKHFEAKKHVVQLVERESHWRVLIGHETTLYDATLLQSSVRAEYPDALVVRMD